MSLCDDCTKKETCKDRKFMLSYKGGLLLTHINNCVDKRVLISSDSGQLSGGDFRC